jgi:hypothetical protein
MLNSLHPNFILDEKRLLQLTPKRFHAKAKKLLQQFNERGIKI